MPTLKLTTWNVEHFSKLIPPQPGGSPRLAAIAQEIEEIDPDVLCIVEASGSLSNFRDWVASEDGLGGRYHVPVIDGTEEILATNPANARAALQDLYAMQGTDLTGNQWIWFLVRDGLFQALHAELLDPRAWRDLTGRANWPVHAWGSTVTKKHRHWRHPQTLLLSFDGVRLEIIGVHLKSKLNRKTPFRNGALDPDYVDKAHSNRARLTTEAYDIRRYIDGRFGQETNPRIFVCGDMNDGPGRDYFERTYLYFDLISNIQGDIFFARRFLNHALFDFDDHLRWTTSFRDRIEKWAREQPDAMPPLDEPVDPTRRQLLDHILFTQALVGEGDGPRVPPRAGQVEHTIHQRICSTLVETSDHTPVSVHVNY